MADWKKTLVAVGAAAGGLAVAYFLLNRVKKKDVSPVSQGSDAASSSKRKAKAKQMTKTEIKQILREILDCQARMKETMREIIGELKKKPLTFEETYKRIKAVSPGDPLEKHGLSVSEFDELLDRNQTDEEVKQAVQAIMGPAELVDQKKDEVSIQVKTVLDVHEFMAGELDSIAKYFASIPDHAKYDSKNVAVSAQALVGAKFEAKFGVTGEDIERAVLKYHSVLKDNQHFADINKKIQEIMMSLMQQPQA